MTKRHKNVLLDHGSNNDHLDGTRAVPSRPAVRIERPAEGEVLTGRSYTFQIGTATGVDAAEVSIDGGGWMPCRESIGLWWYDWSGFDKGAHELAARTRIGDGPTAHSAARRFSAE